MIVNVLKEDGLDIALLGLGLSYDVTMFKDVEDFSIDLRLLNRLLKVSKNLSSKDRGHNKFLESINVWIDVTAPLYFWNQMDTYRIGITKQSTSTMHTLMKKKIIKDMFIDGDIDDDDIIKLENIRLSGDFNKLRRRLPSGFLQRRIISTNYKTLRHIIMQRDKHKLDEWKYFCSEIMRQLKHSYYLK